MRTPEEVRRALALIGASFLGEVRDFCWGPEMDLERARAWAMFEALGWVLGADDSDFAVTLEYAEAKLAEYTRKEEANRYAS